ncbi:MAG: hypothetical protein Q8P47_01495, partial [Candidatus Beckwithbacteria bacterium]|nr:hypothetical protein [Candidatus Beckwithbacteria bacterium]
MSIKVTLFYNDPKIFKYFKIIFEKSGLGVAGFENFNDIINGLDKNGQVNADVAVIHLGLEVSGKIGDETKFYSPPQIIDQLLQEETRRILVSGHNLSYVKNACFEAGADHYFNNTRVNSDWFIDTIKRGKVSQE